MEMSDEEDIVLENGVLKFLLLDSERVRGEWVNDFFMDREEGGEYARIFPDLRNQPDKFYEYFRIMPETFYYILERITPNIVKYSNFRKCISPEEKLMVTLRFLSTGLAFRSLAFSFKISHSAIRQIVYEVCEAIWENFRQDHMPVPTKESLESAADEFQRMWNFPNCVGCIDGKHIRMKCPSNSGSTFFNYKTFFSVILQGVADAHCRFLCIDVGGCGRQSDGGVFQSTVLYQRLEDKSLMPNDKPLPYLGNAPKPPMPYVLLGDQGYPLKTYLLRPYNRQNATESEEIFNKKLSSVRRMVECAFGLTVSKWRVLKTEIQCTPDKTELIVKCACMLHNIGIDKEGSTEIDSYLSNGCTATETHYIPEVDCRRYNRASERAKRIRDDFKHYFYCGK